MLTLLNDMVVIWDRGFSVSDIGHIIHEINAIAYQENLVVAGRRAFIVQ